MGFCKVYDPAPCTPVRHGSSRLKGKGVSEGKGGDAMQPATRLLDGLSFNKNCLKIWLY
ncbi:hypothetical protein DPMN_162246 [Dreissena polymorpha]|uniref:Uncharacterized protein n=1 Tax=Dreissena polymorpha TaxID=45954 RepID=A0A9D4EUR0_DREPO|nr:hypothetical protein DPMN_162246 [Dreissena polymorpha]